MPADKPVTVLCVYKPKRGMEEELLAVLEKHWPTLHATGLVTDEVARLYRATDRQNKREYFVEILHWKDEHGSRTAHEKPEVAALWNAIGPLCSSMSFDHIQPLAVKA